MLTCRCFLCSRQCPFRIAGTISPSMRREWELRLLKVGFRRGDFKAEIDMPHLSQMWHLAGAICCESWQIKKETEWATLRKREGDRVLWNLKSLHISASYSQVLSETWLRGGRKCVSHSPDEVQALLQAIGKRSMQKRKIKDYSPGRV